VNGETRSTNEIRIDARIGETDRRKTVTAVVADEWTNRYSLNIFHPRRLGENLFGKRREAKKRAEVSGAPAYLLPHSGFR